MEPRTPNSVQSSSLLTFRQRRLNFYVVLRKLIPKLQALSQCIQETSMMRFYSSVYSDNNMLIRKMSCDSVFHGNPHPSRCRRLNEDRMCRQRFRPSCSVAQFVSEVRSFWRNAVTFEMQKWLWIRRF